MSNTPNRTEEQWNEELSCCGMSYTASNAEISSKIFVDEEYVKRDALTWMINHSEKYTFVGKEAKKLRQRIADAGTGMTSVQDIDEILSEFFSMLVNNPFCLEEGICVPGKNYIIGNTLDCYFIEFAKQCFIPLGCLERFLHSNIAPIQEEFLKNAKMDAHQRLHKMSLRIKRLESELPEINNNMATYSRFVIGLLTVVLSLIYIISCLSKVAWSQLGTIFKHSANFHQIIGFACEEGFGVNHNLSLSHVLMGIAGAWVIYLALINIRPIAELKNAINSYKLRKTVQKMQDIKVAMPNMQREIDGAYEVARVNEAELNSIHISHGPSKGVEYLYEEKDYGTSVKRALPNTFISVIILALAVGTTVYGYISKQHSYRIAYESRVENQNREVVSGRLKTERRYISVNGGQIYTKDYVGSLPLYSMEPYTMCDIVDAQSSESMIEIKVSTKYGPLTGWVEKSLVGEHYPNYDGHLFRLAATSCDASSVIEKGYEAVNVADCRYDTSWQEGAHDLGIGEWVSVSYGTASKMAAIGIYNGKGPDETGYFANARPTEVRIEFIREGSTVNSVYHELMDGYVGVQYFWLSEPVYADTVKVYISAANAGSMYQETCISEIETYFIE